MKGIAKLQIVRIVRCILFLELAAKVMAGRGKFLWTREFHEFDKSTQISTARAVAQFLIGLENLELIQPTIIEVCGCLSAPADCRELRSTAPMISREMCQRDDSSYCTYFLSPRIDLEIHKFRRQYRC